VGSVSLLDCYSSRYFQSIELVAVLNKMGPFEESENPRPLGEEADTESKSRAAVAGPRGSQIKPSVLEGI